LLTRVTEESTMDEDVLASSVRLSSSLDRALMVRTTPDSELLRLTAAAVNLLLLESIERRTNTNREKG